jgi:hypothetical protein
VYNGTVCIILFDEVFYKIVHRKDWSTIFSFCEKIKSGYMFVACKWNSSFVWVGLKLLAKSLLKYLLKSGEHCGRIEVLLC